jgi:hypothetical protein
MNHQTQTDEPSPGTWLLVGKTRYNEFPVNPTSQQPSGDGPARYRDNGTSSHYHSLKDRHASRGELILIRIDGSLRCSLPQTLRTLLLAQSVGRSERRNQEVKALESNCSIPLRIRAFAFQFALRPYQRKLPLIQTTKKELSEL